MSRCRQAARHPTRHEPLHKPLSTAESGFNIALMLDRNQSAHREGEEHEWYGWVDQRSDDGKESKSRQCAAGEAAPQSHEQKPLPFQPYPC